MILKLYWTGLAISGIWMFPGIFLSIFLGNWFMIYALAPIAILAVPFIIYTTIMVIYETFTGIWGD